MDRPVGSAAPHSDRGAGLQRLGTSHDPPFSVGFGASVALHLVVLLVVAVLPRAEPAPPQPMYWLLFDEPPPGVDVADITGGQGADERQEEARPAPPTPPPTRTEPGDEGPVRVPAEGPVGRASGEAGTNLSGTPGTGSGAAAATAAERLRPALQDSRLWAPLDRGLNTLTPEQRAELELSGRIAEWQDSVAAAEAAANALTDWTKTDAQGRKWGITPGAIHLGDVTIPLPFAFGTPIGQRDEARRRAWEWEELNRGSASGLVRESWKDRAKAIRERRDRERAQAKPDTTPGRR